MSNYGLGEGQEIFVKLIWDNEPIASGELVKLCEKELNWKKATTYTVLRRLCERGLFKNENSIVSSVLSKQEYDSMRSEKFVDEVFGGSLPMFLVAFTSGRRLTSDEIIEIQGLIDKYKE